MAFSGWSMFFRVWLVPRLLLLWDHTQLWGTWDGEKTGRGRFFWCSLQNLTRNSPSEATGMDFDSTYSGLMANSSLIICNLELQDIGASATNVKINYSWSSWESGEAFAQQSPGAIPCGWFYDQLRKGLIKNQPTHYKILYHRPSKFFGKKKDVHLFKKKKSVCF